MKKDKSSRSAFSYISIGFELAAIVLLFLFGGYELDKYYNKTPLFTTIGAFLGMVIGFYHLIRQLQNINSNDGENDKNNKKEKRNKWM